MATLVYQKAASLARYLYQCMQHGRFSHEHLFFAFNLWLYIYQKYCHNHMPISIDAALATSETTMQ
jgi:hypothetical protein